MQHTGSRHVWYNLDQILRHYTHQLRCNKRYDFYSLNLFVSTDDDLFRDKEYAQSMDLLLLLTRTNIN